MLVVIFAFFVIYIGELYKIAPGWGPVARYDSDGTDDLLIRQQLVAAHKAGKVTQTPSSKPAAQRDIWERDPGEKKVSSGLRIGDGAAELRKATGSAGCGSLR